MKNLKRQDRNGSRTTTDIERKYKLGQIDYTAEEIEKLKLKLVVDSSLSASSSNAIANSAVTQALNNKINKETGKGLSSNDYTDADKEKLGVIEANAEENVIESISINGVKQEIKDKNVDIKTSSTGAIETTVVLYEDETGTVGEVPLNENATNYEEIEVFGYRGSRQLYTKAKTNGQYILLNQIRFANGLYYFYTKEYLINGNKLSVEYSKLMYLNNDGTPAIGDDTNIYITRVVGHRRAT